MFYVRLVLILFSLVFCSVVSIFGVFWDRHSLNYIYGLVFAWMAQRICRIHVMPEGSENVRTGRPAVYVANHQSGLDIMIFGTIYPRRAVVIGKKELLLIPIFNLFYVLGGNILIDRGRRVRAISGLNKAADAIHRKRISIWIFPEGTRNQSGKGLLPFKKGAFYLAIQAQVPIIPVVAGPLNPLVNSGERRILPGTIRVRALPPIETEGMREKDVDALLTRTREAMLAAIKELE